MKSLLRLCAAAGVFFCGFAVQAHGQMLDQGNWRAASNTAASITGDIGITPDKLFINFAGFTIAEIRKLTPDEMVAIFEAGNGSGNLYRLNVPADKKFMHHNTLCGSEQTAWMVTLNEGKTLHVAFFSGQKPPVLTPEAISNTTDLCGTFLYVR
jgi:hypothetical protein